MPSLRAGLTVRTERIANEHSIFISILPENLSYVTSKQRAEINLQTTRLIGLTDFRFERKCHQNNNTQINEAAKPVQ